MSACLLFAATVGVAAAAGLQSAGVATADEKLRSVATFVLFLLIVAAVLLVMLLMKNQTDYDLSLKGDDVAASGLTGYGFLVTWYASDFVAMSIDFCYRL